MHIAIYGPKHDHQHCLNCFDQVPELSYRRMDFTHWDNYDAMIGQYPQQKMHMLIVTADGAEGMEAVIAAKAISPETPVMWLTDDAHFGAQSYRLGCSYFAIKPITPQIIASMMRVYQNLQ